MQTQLFTHSTYTTGGHRFIFNVREEGLEEALAFVGEKLGRPVDADTVLECEDVAIIIERARGQITELIDGITVRQLFQLSQLIASKGPRVVCSEPPANV